MRRIVFVIITVLWLALIARSSPGYDFYPLYWGAQRLLMQQSPYGAAATADLAAVWQTVYRLGGVAYPLPVMVLVVPLTFLPFTLAAYIWNGIGVVLAALALRLRNDWHALLPLPICFLPFYRALDLSQATLVWFGLTAVLLLAMHHKRPWMVGACMALLVLKPQNGLLFALYAAWWAWRNDRRALLSAALVGGALGAVSFLVQPTWIYPWLDQIEMYSSIVQPASLLPLGLIVVAVTWPLPSWARVAALQVCLFPIVELYSLLPLLLVWIAIGGDLALAGAAVSWLWALFAPQDLRNTLALWLFVVSPLIAATLWHTRASYLMRWRNFMLAH